MWGILVESVERPAGSSWLRTQAEREARKDILKPSDRFGQLLGIVCFLVLIAFVAIHQTRPTGFFTNDSGNTTAGAIYIMIVVGLVPLLMRLVLGRKNQARPFEAVGNLVFLVGSLYLLVKFPFNFSHFADPLPASLGFLLDWVSATLAKWILGIGVVCSCFTPVYTFILYRAVKNALSRTDAPAPKANE